MQFTIFTANCTGKASNRDYPNKVEVTSTEVLQEAVKKDHVCASYKENKRSKKLHATDRPMATPLFLLYCVQLGISIRDLDLLTIGMVNDMYAESSNDKYKDYAQIATQKDFDVFQQNLCILYNDNVLTLDAYLSILYLNGGVLYGNN